jgi:taurine--2-oxoglutarate transaminase
VILDEVVAGFGRTGSWFAFDDHDVRPDRVTFAMGVNSGHPLAMASIVATLDAMAEEGIVDNARDVGAEVIGPGLAALAEAHPSIGDVRGSGVFWALELVGDRGTREPVTAQAMAACGRAASIAGSCPSPPTTASTWCHRAS